MSNSIGPEHGGDYRGDEILPALIAPGDELTAIDDALAPVQSLAAKGYDNTLLRLGVRPYRPIPETAEGAALFLTPGVVLSSPEIPGTRIVVHKSEAEFAALDYNLQLLLETESPAEYRDKLWSPRHPLYKKVQAATNGSGKELMQERIDSEVFAAQRLHFLSNQKRFEACRNVASRVMDNCIFFPGDLTDAASLSNFARRLQGEPLVINFAELSDRGEPKDTKDKARRDFGSNLAEAGLPFAERCAFVYKSCIVNRGESNFEMSEGDPTLTYAGHYGPVESYAAAMKQNTFYRGLLGGFDEAPE